MLSEKEEDTACMGVKKNSVCMDPMLFLTDYITKGIQLCIQWNLPERPPLLSDHLTKILIGSSISQIAISETSCKQPPPVIEHLKPDIKAGHLWEVPLYIPLDIY